VSTVAPSGRAPLAARTGLALALFVGLVAAVSLLAREPVTALSEAFVQRLGVAGLVLGMLITDTSPIPLIHEPLLVMAWIGGMPFLEILAWAGTASVIAGPIGYGLGRRFARGPRVLSWLDRAGLVAPMRRHGARIIVLTAITPLPFAASTWLAGAVGLRPGPFLAACTARYLKVGVYLAAVLAGWRT
jgi:membrane protein YqaA with SNARE-associated domain